jgi:hypothetical protein
VPSEFFEPSIDEVDVEGRSVAEVEGFEASNLSFGFLASRAPDLAQRVCR